MWRRWRPRAPICSCWRSGACRLLHPVFRDSFFHADMHPGNIFVSYEHPEDPQYIGIDCGIVGSLNKEDKRYLAENFIAFSTAIIVKLPSCTSIPVGFRPIPTLKSLSSRSARSASRSLRSRWRRSPSATCCLICSIPRGVSIWKSSRSSFYYRRHYFT